MKDYTGFMRGPVPSTLSRSSRLWCVLLHLQMMVAGTLSLGATDIIEQRFESLQSDPSIEEVLYYAMGVELAQSGFSTTKTPGDGTYLLHTIYALDGDSLRLTSTLFRAAERLLEVATVDATVKLDDSLDSQIGQMVRQLVAETQLEAQPRVGTKIEGVFTENAQQTPSVEPESPPSLQYPILRVGLGLGGTSFFGPLSEVAHYAATGLLKASFSWRWDDWSLLLGTRIFGAQAFNNPDVTGGPLYLSGAAVGVDVGTGTRQPYVLIVGVSAGALILTVAGTPWRNKAVPWVDGGVGAEFPLAAGWFLDGEIRLQAAFEMIMILGLTPALTINKEF